MDRNAHLDLAAVARAVAPHLADEWTHDPAYPRLLRGPRGLGLLFTSSRPTPRGAVRGQVPDEVYHRHLLRPGDSRRLMIGVDLRREPEAIAREIERRLLPGYEVVFRECVEQLRERHDYDAACKGLVERLEPLVSTRDSIERLSDVEVKATLRLNEAEATAVLTLLRSLRPGPD